MLVGVPFKKVAIKYSLGPTIRLSKYRGSHIEEFKVNQPEGRINDSIELWGTVGSGGFKICVSPNSFQKINIGRLQQSPTEKVLKLNTIFHDFTENLFFSKPQVKLN